MEEQFYLLKFQCYYYNGGFDVHAMKVMTAIEFDSWCNTSILIPIPNYFNRLQEYNEKIEEYKNIVKEAVSKKITVMDVFNTNPNYINRYRELSPTWNQKPRRGKSKIYAFLDNTSDGFSEMFHDYEYGRDLINANIVKAVAITRDFYNLFIDEELQIDMCNVFDTNHFYETETMDLDE